MQKLLLVCALLLGASTAAHAQTGINPFNAGTTANAALSAANNALATANAAVGTANAANGTANTALGRANAAAPLASPAFTGTPTAPTQTTADSTTRLATDAFVHAVTATLAPLASPTLTNPVLTGTVTAPTPAPGDNSTAVATTAYVQAFGAAASPVLSVAGRTGAIALGIGDVSGAAPLASPALTGVPTAPTPATNDNSTTIATTAYVQANAAAASPVSSVAGRTGAITLGIADVTGAAPLASPTFTGNPVGVTQSPGDTSTKLSTDAFVAAAITGLAPVASPTFTGTVTAPALTLSGITSAPCIGTTSGGVVQSVSCGTGGTVTFAGIAGATDTTNAPNAFTALASGGATVPTLPPTDTTAHAINSLALKGTNPHSSGGPVLGEVNSAFVAPTSAGVVLSPWVQAHGDRMGRTVTPYDFGALCNGSFVWAPNGTTGPIGTGTMAAGTGPFGAFGTTTITSGAYATYTGTSNAVKAFPALTAYAAQTGINSGIRPTDTQDWAAIQAAIAYLSGTGGGTLDFPRGSFCQVNAPITVPANVHLRGTGQGASVVSFYPRSNTQWQFVQYEAVTFAGSNSEADGITWNFGGTWAPQNNQAISGVLPIYASNTNTQASTSDTLNFPGTLQLRPLMPINGTGIPAQSQASPTPYLVACTPGVTTAANPVVVNGTSTGVNPASGDVLQLVGGTGNVLTTATAKVNGSGVVTSTVLQTPGLYSSAPTGTVAVTDLTNGAVTGLTVTAPAYTTVSPALCGLNNITLTLNGVAAPTANIVAAGAEFVINGGWWNGFQTISTTAQAVQDTSAVQAVTGAAAAGGQAAITLVSAAGITTGETVISEVLGVSTIVKGTTVSSISGNNVTLSANIGAAGIPAGTELAFANTTSGSLTLPTAVFSTNSANTGFLDINGKYDKIMPGAPVWASSPSTGQNYQIVDAEVACNSSNDQTAGAANTNTDGSCAGPKIWFMNVNSVMTYPNVLDSTGLTPATIPNGTPIFIGGIQGPNGGDGLIINPRVDNVRIHDNELYGAQKSCILGQGTNFILRNNRVHDCWFADINVFGDDTNAVLSLAGPGIIDGNIVYRPAGYNRAVYNGPSEPETLFGYPGGNGARGVAFPKGFDGIGVNQEHFQITVSNNKVTNDDIILNEPCDVAEIPAWAASGLTCPGSQIANDEIIGNSINDNGNGITIGGYYRSLHVEGNTIFGQQPSTRNNALIAGIYLNLGLADADIAIVNNHMQASQADNCVFFTGDFHGTSGNTGVGVAGGVKIARNICTDIGNNGSSAAIQVQNVGVNNIVDSNTIVDDTGNVAMQYAIDTSKAGHPVKLILGPMSNGRSGATLNPQTTDVIVTNVGFGPIVNRPAAGTLDAFWIDPTTGLQYRDTGNASTGWVPYVAALTVQNNVTAAGTTQTTALPLNNAINVVTAGAGAAVCLQNINPGFKTEIFNTSGGNISVFPFGTTGHIGSAGNATAVTLPNASHATYVQINSTAWQVAP